MCIRKAKGTKIPKSILIVETDWCSPQNKASQFSFFYYTKDVCTCTYIEILA